MHFYKACHLSDWNKCVYLFGLSDEKAVVSGAHQHCWSAIICLTEQFFNRSIEIRFNNELHCISLCEAAFGNRKERDRRIEREKERKRNEEGRLSQAWQPV